MIIPIEFVGYLLLLLSFSFPFFSFVLRIPRRP